MKRCYERLGMSRKTLYDKLKKYGISADDESGEGSADDER
jgi:DNA-binding NtrC family response regulator